MKRRAVGGNADQQGTFQLETCMMLGRWPVLCPAAPSPSAHTLRRGTLREDASIEKLEVKVEYSLLPAVSED